MRLPPLPFIFPKRAAGVLLAAIVAITLGALATGRITFEVTHGVSMEPAHRAGDLVLVAKAGSYRRGDIVAYHGGPNGHLTVLHRIIGGDAAGFVVKGDNNHSVDPTRPAAKDIIGRQVFSVPAVGGALRSPVALVALAMLAACLIAVIPGLSRYRRSKRVALHTCRAGRRRRVLSAFMVIIDVAIASALVLSATLPSGHTTAPAPEHWQTQTLAYRGHAERNDAYPTGELGTGDPVFLKLVQHLLISYRYSIDAAAATGSVDLAASVAASNGWHTTISLGGPIPLQAGAAEVVGTLDLGRVRDLVASVAQSTGVGIGTVDITITGAARVAVDHSASASSSSQMHLQMTSSEATLAGPSVGPSPAGPVIESRTPLTTEGRPARPQHPQTRQVRLLLLAALLVALTITAALWPTPGPGARPGPQGESPGSRARAVGTQLGNSTRIQLADRHALERVADIVAAPIVVGDDGWEAVVTPAAIYWIATASPDQTVMKIA